MFFAPWLNALSQRIRTAKRRPKRLTPQQHLQMLRGGSQVLGSHSEILEERCVMTVGPGLVSVTPNGGMFLANGTVRTEAPRELVFQFSPGHVINTGTLGAIEIQRSGGDGVFGNGNDVPVSAAYVDTLSAAEPNKIVYRFASTPVDDLYRITVRGTGAGPVLTSQLGTFLDGADQSLDFQLDLGAQVIAVVPQPVTRGGGGVLTQNPNVIEVYFNNDDLIDTSAVAENPAYYQLIDTKGTASTADDTISLPTGVNYDPALDLATLTFASIPTGTYKLKVGSSPESDGTVFTAVQLGTLFQGSGYTGTQFTGDGGAGDLDLYRFNVTSIGNLSVTVTPDASSTHNTTIRLLDSSGANVATAVLTPGGAGLPDTLTHANLPIGSYFVEVSSTGATTGSYRIDISTTAAMGGSDNNSSYATATDLGILGTAGKTFSATIHPQDGSPDVYGVVSPSVALPSMPGSSDEPGHRDIADEVDSGGSHGVGTLGTPTAPGAIGYQEYNFKANYGSLFGSPLINEITEGQKARIREIFELFSRISGIQFAETANRGWQIVRGDVRGSRETLPPIGGISGSPLIINTASVGADESYGGPFMGIALHEIGHNLGLGHAGDLQAFMDGGGGGTGTAGEVLVGEHDAVHLRARHPLFSTDIDLYKFDVTETGTFTAEITAERLTPTSLLDSALTLFRDPYARASSEFGTAGGATVTFTSVVAGVNGNDIRVIINEQDLGPGTLPTVSLSGHDVTVTVNLNGAGSTLQQVVDAVNNPLNGVTGLISASVVGNSALPATGLVSGTTLNLGGGNREVVARNDDYNSNDAFLNLQLTPGTYYLGVTSTGNTSYDPTVANTGYGGNTDGAYDLRLGFTPSTPGSLATLAAPVTSAIQTTLNVVDASLLPSDDGNGASVDFVVRIGSELLAVTNVVGNTLTVQRGFGGTTPAASYSVGTALTSLKASSLVDADNVGNASSPVTAQLTTFDGDADGQPGGDFEFWFQSGTTVFVDKATTVPVGSQTGAIAAPFSTIAAAVARAGSRIVTPTRGAAEINDGDFFFIVDGNLNPAKVFEFNRTDVGGGVNGNNVAISIDPTDNAAAIAIKIAGAITSQASGTFVTTATASGDFVNLTSVSALNMSGANGLLNSVSLIRIVGNGGTDGNLATEADASPYLIGVDNSTPVNTLADGRTFAIPQGVTVMIDAGTVIKLQNANIDVGTDENVAGTNRQDAALQILGTPRQAGTQNNSVFLTTYHNDAIGGNSDGASSGADRGQWGGIIFRRDSDMNDNFAGDRDGGDFFLNSLYQADISYGGGPAPTTFSSVHIIDERPTIAYSRITNSAEAAISADPNSFDDSLNRVGPDIHGNTLVVNSTNGVLVRIRALAGEPVDKLDRRARFDDTDVTHVISEQLHLVGNVGGATIVNEQQQLTVQGTPSGGSFTLTFPSGGVAQPGTTSIQALGATTLAANITTTGQTAITVANAAVFPTVDASPATVDFVIRIGNEEMNVTHVNLATNTLTVQRAANGTAAATNVTSPTTHGAGGNVLQISLRVQDASVFPNVDTFTNTIDFYVQIGTETLAVRHIVGDTLTVNRAALGSTLQSHASNTAVTRARTTIDLPYNATAAQIQSALEALDGIGPRGVRVTGGPMTQAPVNVEFINDGGSANQVALVVNNTNLVNGNVVNSTITEGGVLTARLGARLRVDPGVVVKLNDTRIEGERGSSQLIAEGTSSLPVIFTSLQDDRYGGASGSFDTSSNGAVAAIPGDWGGLFFGQGSRISVDQGYIAFGGGNIPISGDNANFAAIEAHEADLRLANTTFEFNANGADGSARNFRTGNVSSTVFIKGAQPIIVNNTFHNNQGTAISIDVNALRDIIVKDPGRTTGTAQAFHQFDSNVGPLVRLNRMDNDLPGFNGILGMQVRAAEVITQSVWDDTDIVHVVTSGIISLDNKHTFGGLRLQSAVDASLVVKLGTGAGFAIGDPDKNGNNGLYKADLDDGPLDIDDRIGGTMQVIGAPGFPVILTSINDDSVGASLDTTGFPQTDTNSNGSATNPAAGNWGEILFDKYAHDRNVAVHLELEKPQTGGIDVNSRLVSSTDTTAELLGNLAPNNKSANENRRAGFEIHGTIAYDDPTDVDIYQFIADAGTEIWLDIDLVDPALNTIVEFVMSNGTVQARSQGLDGGGGDLFSNGVTALPLQKNVNLGNDYYTTTINDAGMRLVTPGAAGTQQTYYVRVRSNPGNGNITDLNAGATSGNYQLQLRLGQRDETPGVAVKFADIRYSTNGIHVKGLPYHSPLLGESTEFGTNDTTTNTTNATPGNAILLGDVMFSDRNGFSAGGRLSSETDVDFYKFHIDYAKIQEIAGLSNGGKTWPLVIDLDWADGLTRPDTTMAIFTQSGQLIYLSRESNVRDDRPVSPLVDNDLDDLSRGSIGTLDPFIGTAMFAEAQSFGEFYYVAIVNNQLQPQALAANFVSTVTDSIASVRLEPVTSIRRIAEDHIGFTGYTSNGNPVDHVGAMSLFSGISNLPLIEIDDRFTLSAHAAPLTFNDIVLFSGTTNSLSTNFPLNGTAQTTVSGNLGLGGTGIQDLVMRSDGQLFGYDRNAAAGNAGRLVTINTGNGAVTAVGGDGIPDGSPPAGSTPFGNATQIQNFERVTNTTEVDALTFRRTGFDGTNNVPTYTLYYSVRENHSSGVVTPAAGNAVFNSKLYSANSSTGAIGSFIGDIQWSGTNPATDTLFFSDGTNSGTILFQTRAQGSQANGVRLVIQRTNGATQVVGAANGVVTVNVNYNFGNNSGTTSIQTVVDTINNDGNANQIMTAVVSSGNAGTLVTFNQTSTGATGGTNDNSGQRIHGNVTGLAMDGFSGTILYGVTSGEGVAGRGSQLIRIDQSSGNATIIRDFTSLNIGTTGTNGFQGLHLGPQNAPIVVGTLAADITSTQTSFTLNSLNALPTAPFDLLIGSELMRVTTRVGNTVTVTRNTSTATIHSAGDSASIPGYFAHTLFAVTNDGRLLALNTDATLGPVGSGLIAFDSNRQVQTVSMLGLQQDLAGAVAVASTTITVADTSVFDTVTPFRPFDIQVGTERMTVTSIVDGTTLAVTRGVDSQFVTNVAAASPITTGTNTITVANGALFTATTPFMIRIDGELMQVNSIGGNTLNVTRGAAVGSVRAAHNGGVAVYQTSAVAHAIGEDVFDLRSEFTLTYDTGAALRTTAPLNVNAPGAVSLDEIQQLDVVAYSGTWGIDIVNDFAGTTALAQDVADLNEGDPDTIFVQSTTGFPAAPFIIRIEDELLLVNSIGAGSFNVTRGVNGSIAVAHQGATATAGTIAPETVYQVVTMTLNEPGNLPAAATATLTAGMDATTNTVTTAGILPGVADGTSILLIDGEQMLVTAGQGTNVLTVSRLGQNGTTVAGHGSGATVTLMNATINVVDTTGFTLANTPFIRINNEVMRMVSVGATSLNVLRASNGTTTAAHTDGSVVERIIRANLSAVSQTDTQIETAILTALTAAGIAATNADIATVAGAFTGVVPAGSPATPVTIQLTGLLGRRDWQSFRIDTSNLVGDDIDRISLGSSFYGGTFTLQFTNATTGALIGTTGAIAFDADQATIEAALTLTLGFGNFRVFNYSNVGGPGTAINSFDVQFTGQFQDLPVTTAINSANSLQNREINTLRRTGGVPTSGSFDLVISVAGLPAIPTVTLTGADLIAFGDDGTTIQNKINNAITATGVAGSVTVTPAGGTFSGGTTYTITYLGVYEDRNVTLSFNAGNNSLNNGATPTFTTIIDGNSNGTATAQQNGSVVYGPVHTTQQGNLGIFDALTTLPGTPLSPVTPDIQVTGGALPGSPVNITFTAAGTRPLLLVNNTQMVNYDGVNYDGVTPGTPIAGEAEAFVAITGTPGDGLPDNFVVTSGALSGSRGLAFSPLDINLWHPTMRRNSDTGHGINQAFDNSRTPGAEARSLDYGNDSKSQSEGTGGASLYFGLEQMRGSSSNSNYFAYQATNGQLGVLNNEWQRDLTSSSNPTIIDNNSTNQAGYNLPGGAFGKLTTNAVNLSAYVAEDKPTLYFNYLLETQGASSSQGNSLMRDSARVFASPDGGLTWTLLATNNSTLASELPEYLAHASNYSGTTLVQELFETTQWRQARVDLSDFAGQPNLIFRFDFSTAGNMNDTTLPSETEGVGNFFSNERGQQNNFEGFYIDDIIVGFAERGELVTSAPNTLSTFDNLYNSGFASGRADINRLSTPPSIISAGEYQFEIRRGTAYAAPVDPTASDIAINPGNILDTNDRWTMDFTSQPGPVTETFDFPGEYSPFDVSFGSGAGSSAAWFRSTARFQTDPRSFQSGAITNGQFSSTTLTMTTGAGVVSFDVMVDAAAATIPLISTTYNRLQFFIDGVAQTWVVAGNPLPVFPTQFPGTGTLTPSFVPVSFTVTQGTHTFEWRYTKGNANVLGSDAAFIDNLSIPQPANVGRLGDQNVEREQGMVILEGNFIRNVSQNGILIEPGDRDSGSLLPTNLPYGGAVRQTPVLNNNERLVTHALLVNNVITNFGTAGIRYLGDNTAAADPLAAVPMGKIINNTIYGGGTATGGTAQAGTGIFIGANTSPTLMNNIIANTALGISDSGNNTDITTTLFQNIAGNNYGAQGNSPILNSGNTSPLFVDPATGNFYLAAGITGNANEAIDASLNVRFARTNYTAITNPLGIPPDPNPFDASVPGQDMFAPDVDRFGQLRQDDPSTFNSLGIFRDIGGIERADFAGPTANLTVPLDNAAGIDLDLTQTRVSIDNPALLTQFVVKLLDAGIGVADPQITSDLFVLIQTDITGTRTLEDGVDYFFAYNANTNEAIFTSVTIFPSEARYNIQLNRGTPNNEQVRLTMTGNPTGGTFRLTFGAQTTAALPFNATAVQVQNALAALSTIGAGNVTVSGGDFPGAPMVVEFIGTLADTDVGAITANTALLTGGTTPGMAILALTQGNLLGIRDYASNIVQPNQLDGTTQFFILVTNGQNDAPVISLPATPTTAEDTPITLSIANGNAIQISDSDQFISNGDMQVTLTATGGTFSLNPSAIAALNFTFVDLVFGNGQGDGTNDPVMTFRGTLAEINAALDGLVFTPAADQVDTNTPPGADDVIQLAVTVNDLGEYWINPTDGSRDPKTDSATLAFTVTPINDEPVFAFNTVTAPGSPATFTVNEDETAANIAALGQMLAVNFGPGPVPTADDEYGQTLTFTLTETTGGSTTAAALFATAPTLTVRTGTTAGSTLAGVNSLTLNDATQFSTLPPGSFTIQIGSGAALETLTVNSVAGNVLNLAGMTAFPHAANELVTHSSLAFTLNSNVNGFVNYNVVLTDNGLDAGTPAPGDDDNTSQTIPLRITVTAVNDEPSLTFGTVPPVNEDVGPQTVTGLVTFSPGGGPDEAAQTWTAATIVGATSDRGGWSQLGATGAIFSAISINPATGTLTYTLQPDVNGNITVTVTATDSGAAGPAPNDNSVTTTFQISVNPVNDKPSVAVPNFHNVPSGSEALAQAPGQSAAGFATPTFGPPTALDENTGPTQQAVANYIMSAPMTLFGNLSFVGGANPDINEATGTLTYTTSPGPATTGIAAVTVTIQDDGTTALGGVDTGDPVDFYIVVGQANPALPILTGVNNWTAILDATATNLEIRETGNLSNLLFTQSLATLTNGILIRGTSVSNELTFDYTNGTPIPAGVGIIYAGGSGAGVDTMRLINGTVGSVNHTLLATDQGTLVTNVGGGPGNDRRINYIQLEPSITDELGATSRTYTFADSADTITVDDNASLVDGLTSLISTASTPVLFRNPTTSLTINADTTGAGLADTLNLRGLDPLNPAVGITVNGGSGSDLLTGRTGSSNSFNMSSLNAGTLNGATFNGFENLQGGSATDTLSYSTYGSAVTVNLQTGAATDLTSFSNIENFVGGSGGDQITGQNLTPNTWTVTGTNAGSLGNVNGTFTFSAFETMNGGTGTDTVIGQNVVNTWNVTGAGSGNVTGGFAFTGMENLTGNSNNDTFTFAAGALITGTINGGASGTDILNFGSYATAITVTLTGSTANGFNGTTAGTPNPIGGGFSNIDSVAGGAGNDILVGQNLTTLNTWNVSSANTGTMVNAGGTFSFSGIETLQGGTGTGGDTLVGPNLVNTWNVTGAGAGNITGVIAFTQMENLSGNANNDTFVFGNGGSIAGTVNGGSGSNDVLSYASRTTPVTVSLPNSSATDIFGGAANGFIGIESFVGSSGPGNDTLIGTNSNTNWFITSMNTGNFTSAASSPVFTSFENLTGGTGNDAFLLSNGVGVTGTINGGGSPGTDTLSYAAYVTPVSVTLGGVATNVGNVQGIENVVGGSTGSDTLTGPNAPNNWNLTASSSGNIVNSGTITFSSFEALNGGNQTDAFLFGAGVVFNTIGGGAGIDALNWSSYGSARNVVLTATTVDGFSGTESGSIPGGFTGINSIIGSASNDSLTGFGTPSTWELDGTNRYIENSTTRSLDFASFETLNAGNGGNTYIISGAQTFNLTGGTGNDTFQFNNGATLTGAISGLSGTDTLNFASSTTGQTYQLTNADANGFTGTVAAISGGFSGIDSLNGGAGTDSLNGISGQNALWGVSPVSRTYTALGFTLGFTSLENLNGNGGVDTFSISGANSVSLNGGDNNDLFVFANGATISGTLAGGNGNDTVDYSANVSPVSISLGSLNSIESLIGGSGSDTIIGLTTGTTFTLTGSNTGTADAVSFQSFENLTGQSGSDTFTMTDTGAFTGVIDGGTGSDTLDYNGVSVPRTFTLTAQSGSDGYTGTESSLAGGFRNINTIIGSSQPGDVIAGTNNVATWDIGTVGNPASRVYTSLTRTLSFLEIETAQGGLSNDVFNITGAQAMDLNGGLSTGLDTFNFANGATLTGNVDGGGGNDTLSFAAYTTSISVTLNANNTLDGFGGTTPVISGAFSNIETLTGGAASDTLTGNDFPAAWEVDGTNRYSNPTVDSTRFLNFGSWENLIGGLDTDTFTITGNQSTNLFGGDGDDTFILTAVSNLTGTIDGGAGNNTYDLSQKTAGVSINVAGLTNLQTVLGTAGSDTLVGGAGGNLFQITGANDVTVGSVSFSGFENLTGGSGADTFQFTNDSASLSGTINGMTGTDTLDYSGYSTVSHNTTLGNLGSLDGFNGTSTGLTFGFSNIEALIGGSTASDSIQGLNATSSWSASFGAVVYSSTRTMNITFVEQATGGNQADNFNLTSATDLTQISGGPGNDTLNASGLTSGLVLNGGAGNDTIFGGLGDDTIDGGTETDQLRQTVSGTQTLDNTTLVGLGTDTFTSVEQFSLSGGAAGDLIDASAYNAGSVTLIGGLGNDTLLGGSGNDSISGGDGDDSLSGGAGTDNLDGGNNNDTVGGGAGTDVLAGGLGTDVLADSGLSGTVTLNLTALINGAVTDTHSGFERASLEGAATNDSINTTAFTGNVTVRGGDGDDTIVTGSGADFLYGENGNDRLTGGTGNDNLSGGANSDVLVETADASFTLTNTSLAGVGTDTLGGDIESALLTGGASANTITATSFTNGGVTLIGLGGNDSITGTNFNDVIDGGLGADTLRGNSGADTIRGYGNPADSAAATDGIDSIDGGSGNDTIDGQAGNDILLGGNDNDVLTGGAGNDSITGGAGTDQVKESGNVSFTLSLTGLTGNGTDTLSQIENAWLTGGASNNTLSVTTFTGPVTLQGLGGNDSLVGGSNADVLEGGDGDDSLTGKTGDDILDGGANSTLAGSLGDVVIESGATSYILSNSALVGAGSDVLVVIEQVRLTTHATAASSVDATAFTGRTTITGSSASDTLFGGDGVDSITAGSGADKVKGNGGADFILGGAGNDTIRGGEGNDTIDGGTENDLVAGDNGNDSLLGGLGNDTLGGGAGNDILNGNDGNDTLSGGSENDNLLGGNNDDYLQGDSGNDTLSGQGGNDKYDNVSGGGTDSIISGTELFMALSFDFDTLIMAHLP